MKAIAIARAALLLALAAASLAAAIAAGGADPQHPAGRGEPAVQPCCIIMIF